MESEHGANESENNTHQKNLEDLCRICCKILGGKKQNKKLHIVNIEKCFHININLDNTYHPNFICHKCYLTMTVTISRDTTCKLQPYNNWAPHSLNCKLCKDVSLLRKGIVGLQKLKRKKVALGRPKSSLNTWSQANLNALKEKIPPDEFPTQLNLKSFSTDINPYLSLCKCEICEDLIRKPTIIKSCQHTFCFSCIALKIKSKNEKDCFCPTCKLQFSINDLSYSTNVDKLLKLLMLSCQKCHKKFNPITELLPFSNHEKECSFSMSDNSSKMSVSDVFNLSEESELPRLVEDVALHVIRTKMSNSKLPNNAIAFKTDGRVSLFFLKYKIL